MSKTRFYSKDKTRLFSLFSLDNKDHYHIWEFILDESGLTPKYIFQRRIELYDLDSIKHELYDDDYLLLQQQAFDKV